MGDLLPLASLADPVAFLKGARIPVAVSDPVHGARGGEWVSDAFLIWSPSSEGEHWREESIGWCIAFGSLDPADPDVARWCDRKIVQMAHPVQASGITAAFLHVRRDVDTDAAGWIMGVVMGSGIWLTFTIRAEPTDRLAAVPCDEAHIPTARRALILALYGKAP